MSYARKFEAITGLWCPLTFWAARAPHGCIQRVSAKGWVSCKMHRDVNRLLQLLIFRQEFLVSASHELVLTKLLPFVHTARRFYR